MKIALAQIDVIAGNPQHNFNNMKKFISEAKQKNVDLISFPEMCVSGYLIGDLYRDSSFISEIEHYNDLLRKESKDIAIAFGSIYRDKEKRNNDGRFRLYNAVHIYVNKKPAKRDSNITNKYIPDGLSFKSNLPTYRFFDDSRYFFSMIDLCNEIKGVRLEELFSPFIIPTKDGKEDRVGFELCEDMWSEDYSYANNYDTNLKNISPTQYLSYYSPKAIINLSASPWTYGKRDARHNVVKKLAQKQFSPFFYVNCSGVQNNGKNIITFDGGSTIYDKNEKKVAIIDEPYSESLLIADPDNLPKKANEKHRSKIEEKYLAIIRGIRSFKDSAGLKENPNVVIGMSGGIDSSVSAALFVKAFGKDKVIGINMPTEFNSKATQDAAMLVAKHLGIKYDVIPIGDLVNSNKDAILRYTKKQNKTVPNMVLENMQAKIRGATILSNLSQVEGGIWSNNGNKIEVALGYATLYGDWGGAISPLGDLTKAEVYEMAHFINNHIFKKEIICRRLMPDKMFQFSGNKIKPSAELKEEQVDPIKIGYHCSLIDKFLDYRKKNHEDIMQWWLDGTLAENLEINHNLIKIYGLNNANIFLKDLEWFYSTMQKQVFKRVQSVPIIITSKTAFGYDLRESILPPMFWTIKAKSLSLKIKRQKDYKPIN